MGGVPPLGYEVQDRKLVVNDAEAETVRHIFARYLTLGSVHRLRDALKTEGIVSRAGVYRTGHQTGGKPLGRGALYRMLQNRIYLGEIVHKENSYPGEHAAIIDASIWRSVQAQLEKNRVERAVGERARAPSLLGGRLFDAKGQRLTPSHAVKGGKRYRYYLSQPLTVGRAADVTNARRIPAGELEQLVLQRLQQFFADRGEVLAALDGQVEAADALAGCWFSHCFAPGSSNYLALLGELFLRLHHRWDAVKGREIAGERAAGVGVNGKARAMSARATVMLA